MHAEHLGFRRHSRKRWKYGNHCCLKKCGILIFLGHSIEQPKKRLSLRSTEYVGGRSITLKVCVHDS